MRWAWLAGGHAAVALGVVGLFLPLLPTTPFLLLAAFCYGRGSEKFEAWLVNHPKLGPMIRDWRSHRVIRPRAKLVATLTITASMAYVTTRERIPLVGKIAAVALVAPPLVFIVTRPSRPT